MDRKKRMEALARVMVDVFDGEWPEERTTSSILYFVRDEDSLRIRASLNRVGGEADIPLTKQQEVRVLLSWVDDEGCPGCTDNIRRDMFERVAREEANEQSEESSGT